MSWHNQHMAEWMAPWVRTGVWTFVVGGLIGIAPGSIYFLINLRKPPVPDWSGRVRARVQIIMLNAGWLLLAVGFAPVFAFFIGFHAVYAIGYPQGYASLIPIGITCWLLAIVPTNERATQRALKFTVGFFCFFGLIGLLAVVFWGVLSFWIAGVFMGIVFIISSVIFALTSARELRSSRDPRTGLRRVWKCMRLFFAVLVIVSIALLIEYTVNLSSQWSENVGWIALALTSSLCSVLTHPPWRNAFCVWLSGVGVKIGDKAEAMGAAKLIWIEMDEPAKARPAQIAA